MFMASAAAHLATCSLSPESAARTTEHRSLWQPLAVAADSKRLPKLERTGMDPACPAARRRHPVVEPAPCAPARHPGADDCPRTEPPRPGPGQRRLLNMADRLDGGGAQASPAAGISIPLPDSLLGTTKRLQSRSRNERSDDRGISTDTTSFRSRPLTATMATRSTQPVWY